MGIFCHGREILRSEHNGNGGIELSPTVVRRVQ